MVSVLVTIHTRVEIATPIVSSHSYSRLIVDSIDSIDIRLLTFDQSTKNTLLQSANCDLITVLLSCFELCVHECNWSGIRRASCATDLQ